jgi:glycosyltransferase involved in cell wall biosynthesis
MKPLGFAGLQIREPPVGAGTAPQSEPDTRYPCGAPALSVIIPHYDDLANLRACLGLLAAQSAPREDFEIIVADNNSACGLGAVAGVCGDLARAVSAPIQGAGPARNAAVRHARGRYLAFTDSDCLPHREWAANGIRAICEADMVGGGVKVILADGIHPTPTEAFELVLAFNNERYVKKLGFSSSSNMFVRKAVFGAVGDFRATVAEDMDWGRRAVAMGYRWRYAPDVLISHPARRDWAELTRKWRRLTSEAFALTKERRFGRAYCLARSWLVMLSPVRDASKILTSSKLERFQDRIGALRVLLRMRLWRLRESHAVLFK